MRKYILAPDSFKGTMGSAEICGIMKNAILEAEPGAEVVSIPVADGGEGSVDAFLAALGGEKTELEVTGPLGYPVTAFYGMLPGKTAVIEMAAAAGLPLVKGAENPMVTTTYGVGELIAHAARSCRALIIGLGGSATNDGGAGAAAALGVKFYKASGECFIPAGGTLKEIDRIDASGLLRELRGVSVTVMCDIDNPLCGENGASRVFGPQKGADEGMAFELDEGLFHLAGRIKRDLGADILNLPGAGAAGGMGGGLTAFLGGQLKMGIETVLDTVHFDKLLESADFVLTGEGRIDAQSARGKVVSGVARRARTAGVPVIAVVGDIGEGAEQLYEQGVSGIFSTNRICMTMQEARRRSRDDLYYTTYNIIKFIGACGGLNGNKETV